MDIRKGCKIEEAMMKWFKGESHPAECVDFQTKTSLYEVKSCNLLNRCLNRNDKRKYLKKPHKRIASMQLGRFFIKISNHKKLLEKAKSKKKIPKYIFVIKIGKQKIWRVKSWWDVDLIIPKKKRYEAISIKDIFNGIWGED